MGDHKKSASDGSSESRRPTDWVADFLVSETVIERFSDPEWIVESLIERGALHAIVAEANGGKTTILMHLCPQIANLGYRVYYVNADTNGAHAKAYWKQARDGGFNLLLPDLAGPGASMDQVVSKLAQMVGDPAPHDYERDVWIFDTLKKMTDMISKRPSKRLYGILRALTARGSTIVALGHVNKYKGEDGKPIYEGTGDLRNDFDNLIYMIPHRESDGRIIVSTEPDKVRASFKPLTFTIARDRTVTQTDYVDTAALGAADLQREKAAPVIEAVSAALSNGITSQFEIAEYVNQRHDIGKHRIRRVLRDFEGSEWSVERGQNNRCIYRLINANSPP